MEIDYSYSQLPDDELAEHLQERAREADIDRERAKARKAKLYDFRFTGGLC